MARVNLFIHRCGFFITVTFLVILIRTFISEFDQYFQSQWYYVSNWNRKLKIKLFQETPIRHILNSTCSPAADRRGHKQKIISYSLYGNFSRKDIVNKYFLPLKDTMNLIPEIYPGWIVRVYHNMTKYELEYLNFSIKSHVDLCNVTEIIQNQNLGNLFAMTWRWLPLLDDMVDYLMSRDTDSQIIPREKEAVHEWLTSQKVFHVMRDHPAHCTIGPILGGCWGVKINMVRSKIFRVAEQMFTINHSHEYDYDQVLLGNFIWPIAKKNMMAHDSFCCQIFQPNQPYPTRRSNGLFVGARTLGNNKTEILRQEDKCPQQCRLRNSIHLSDWDFC